MGRVIGRLSLLASTVLVASCGTTNPGPTATSPPAGFVTEADLGDDWPLAIASVTLHCHEDAASGQRYVTFSVEDEPGVEYAVSEAAIEFGHPDLDDFIMPAYPDRSVLEPLVERGLELCEG